MPNTRMLLWVALAAILYFNYQAWTLDYPAGGARDAVSRTGTGAPGSSGTLGDSVPQAASTAALPATPPAAPASTTPAGAVPAAPEPFAASPASAAPAADAGVAQPLHVTTDVFDVVINLKGGELDQADLLQYPLRKDAPNIPVRLMSREPPSSLYLLQTGLTGGAGEAAPTHLATWSSAGQSFVLA